MSERRPDFFIVGAPKSGTTAMYEYLREHPDLYMPERKELRFFGSDLDIRDRHRLSTAEYLAHFAEADGAPRVGSAYVWYLFSRAAAGEIADFSPGARIIAMLRNPIDMLHALHGEHLSNGNENLTDFTEALDAEPDRRQGRRIPPHAHLPAGLLYTSVPRYTEQLQRYADAFGRERLHVIIFDDFVADTGTAYRDALRFLDVGDEFRPMSFGVVNASKRTRSERMRHFLSRPPELPRRIIHHVVPARVRRAMYERAKRLNVAAQPRTPIPAATHERLRVAFADEVQRLSAFLDRDLSAWSRPPEVPAPE